MFIYYFNYIKYIYIAIINSNYNLINKIDTNIIKILKAKALVILFINKEYIIK